MVLINQDPGESQEKDRISELPHSLINLILGFLPTKCVVSTSVLSKRWRHIWTSVPVLELEFPRILEQEYTTRDAERVWELYLLQPQSFMNFVDTKLSLHHETRDIKKFYLDSRDHYYYQTSRVEEWLSSLLTRHSLEEFVFYAERSPDIGFFPSSGTFASLVTLESEVDLFTVNSNETKMLIDYINQWYTDIPAEDYILHRFESLVDAEIDFKRFGVPLPQGEDLVATEVLEKLSNVKLLKISGESETFEALAFPNDLLTNWPTFHNLVHLEFTSAFLEIYPALIVVGHQTGLVMRYDIPDMFEASHNATKKHADLEGQIDDVKTMFTNSLKELTNELGVLRRMGKDKKVQKKKGDGSRKSSKAKEKNYQRDDSQAVKNKAGGCFLCKGPHLARDCPKRVKLSAIVTEGSGEKEETDEVEHVNPIQLCNIVAQKAATQHGLSGADLVYVKVGIHNHRIWGMADTGASHTVMSLSMAEYLVWNYIRMITA
ncbi:hypothetical protein C5167_019818 [Papaver somniferum]|uniref:F-box domain-containing protein n=1 Tax=Papaver somniferum TaxID=3469 RepID=A0A4Y7IV70_PAPSO|nr:hypothetical protein C5167_019818 [Papaver somniferum]